MSRLNLGSGVKTGVGGPPVDKRLSGAGAGLRPPMAKLNLAKLNLQRSETEENRTPLSARVSPAAAAGPGAAAGGDRLTPRGSGTITTPRGGTSWLTERGSDSEASSPSRLSQHSSVQGAEAGGGGGEVEVESFELVVSPPRPLTSRTAARRHAATGANSQRAAAQLPKLALPLGRSAAQPALQQPRGSALTGSRLSQARRALGSTPCLPHLTRRAAFCGACLLACAAGIPAPCIPALVAGPLD